MSEQLQLRRGSASQVAAFTGAQGEVAVDTTNNRVVVQDGATAGGWPHALATRTQVSDAAYAALVTDRQIAYTALTAARAVTLPAASSYPTGAKIEIFDESGNCSLSKTITVGRAGSDTISGSPGSTTSVALSGPNSAIALESNGVSQWTILHARTADAARTAVNDAAYAALITDRLIAYTAITASRTVTLPAAAAFPAGTPLFVVDESGSVTATNTIVVARAGSDTINGATSATIAAANGFVALESNGSNAWTLVDGSVFLTAVSIAGGLQVSGGILTAKENTGNPTPVSGTIGYFVAADGVSTFIGADSYGTGVHSDVVLRLARGTAASPSAVQLGDELGQVQFRGYGATGFGAVRASLKALTAENWTDTAQGANFYIVSTAPGTTSAVNRLAVLGTGQTVYFGAQADQSKSAQTPTTGFSITFANTSTTLLLTPAGTLATGTIIMPSTPVDGQIARVLSSQTVSALTVSPNAGQSISGAPATVGPTTPFSMIYDLASTTWYRMS